MINRNVIRRGSATIWLIVTLPVLLILFCFVLNIAQQWLARVELENALEAAALAAVKEWGDANGGDTLIPREVGVEYANLNRMRGFRVQIATNYDPDDGVNQNKRCDVVKGPPPDGNLIFGSIEDVLPGEPVVFNAGIAPNCATGNVVFDVTSNGELNSDAHNDWGIAFHPSPGMPPNLRINYIIIDLQASNIGNLTFLEDFQLSDNVAATWLVHDNDNPRYEQPDLYGFSDYGAQIQVSYSADHHQLRFDFSADPAPGGDLGFEPCDRFRFGNSVDFDNLNPGNLRDADGVGHVLAQVTVGFSDGSVATGNYSDTTHPKQCAGNPAECGDFPCDVAQPSLIVPPCPTGLDSQPVKKYVHPTQVDDIPCPAAAAPDNNGQSLAFVGAGRRHYAVRAQATVNVSPLCRCLCAFNGDYCVSGKTIAIYDCVTRRPRLIRVDVFICPGP